MDSNKTSEEPLDAIKDKLAQLVRHAAISRLKKHADCAEIEVSEIEAGFIPGRILANHMAFILISGNSVRVTFKTHFNTGAAKSLGMRVFGSDMADDVSEKQAFDFIKEYCNLVAGYVVTLFEGVGIDMGIGLPLCTRGFYEVFSDYEEMVYPSIIYSDFWRMQANGNEVYCSALFEIIDEKPLECLIGYEIPEETNIDGEIEFL